MLLVNFLSSQLPSNITSAYAHDVMFGTTSLDRHWRESSYGKAFATGAVFGPFNLTKDYDCTQHDLMRSDAIAAADATVDFTQYSRIVLVFPNAFPCAGGLGTVGCEMLNSADGTFQASTAWIRADIFAPIGLGVCATVHELGHGLGLEHASSLGFGSAPLGALGATGGHDEYGDRFSLMGLCFSINQNVLLGHYAAPHKVMLGWLTGSSQQTVLAPGNFTLAPYENNTTALQAIKVQRGQGTNRWLWVEYRQPIGYDASFSALSSQVYSGALIHYEDATQDAFAGYTQLLDFTAASTPSNFNDAALPAGASWSDPYTPLTLVVNSATSSGLNIGVQYDASCVTLSPPSASAGALSTNASTSITAAGTCSWTALSNDSWIIVTGTSSGSGNGTVFYSLSANTTPNTRVGTISIARQLFTITQRSANAPPTPVSVTPSSGSRGPNIAQQFQFVFSDQDGATNLLTTGVLINFTAATANTCYLVYDRVANQLRLYDDTGSSWSSWNPGAQQTLSNSACTVFFASSSALVSGNNLTLTLSLSFTPAFVGTKAIYGSAQDAAGGDSGLVALGSWIVLSLPLSTSKVGAYNAGYWALDKNGSFGWDGTAVDQLSFWSLGQPGEIPVYGDWNGDGRTKIGLYVNGTWLLDYNGNGVWDGPNVDKLIYFGGPGYQPLVGDWNGSGTSKIAVHQNGTWLIDYNGNFQWDGPGTDKLIFFGGVGYTPVLGDWNGSGTTKIGVHQNGTWLIDFNGNFQWDGPATDKLIFFGGPGYTPVVGDWNGSGTTKIGAYLNGLWLLDYNGNFAWDGVATDKLIFFGGQGYTPIVGDWNGSGTTKVAAYLNGQWVLDVNGNFLWDPPTDKVIFFGGAGQTPVVGKW